MSDSSKPVLPPPILLKMALDYLYSRALQLGLPQTALFIGTAAMSAELEAKETAEHNRRRNRGAGKDSHDD